MKNEGRRTITKPHSTYIRLAQCKQIYTEDDDTTTEFTSDTQDTQDTTHVT